MSEVLYRKWRPQRLDQVVGQEPVTQTLRRAVALGRTAHAYLFCGPRGTGKTSSARILAKAVNCLAPEDGEPDNECEPCQAINEGRALDLIEIDAASNRGIDDIRNLRDKITFAPSGARYKVYIIDEVHMLTEPAFNALLKTLEEPPGHAIFVLATTEVHKLPLTIISRCQRFDFRRIPLDVMVARLELLCADEQIEASPEALRLIGRTAAGSLRDAENLLEQALVSFGSPLGEDQVRDLMGLGGDETALELVGHVVNRRVREGMKAIDDAAGQGGDLRQLHRGVIEHLRAVLLLKAGADASFGYPEDIKRELSSLAEATSIEHLVQALKIFARADMRRDSSSPLPLELAVADSSMEPAAAPAAPAPPPPRSAGAAARPVPGRTAPAPGPRRPPPSENVRTAPASTPRQPPEKTRDAGATLPAEEGQSDLSEPAVRLEHRWATLVNSLRQSKGKQFWLGPLLKACVECEVSDGSITLKFSHRSHMERMQGELEDPQSRRTLEDAFSKVMDEAYGIRVSVVDGPDRLPARSPAARSPLVRAAQALGARVVDEKEDENGQQEDDTSGPAAPAAHAGSSTGA